MSKSDSKTTKSKRQNPLKPKRDFKSYLKFLLIGLVLLFVVDYLVFGKERPYITKMKADYYAKQVEKEHRLEEAIEQALPPKVVYPEEGEYFEAPIEEPVEMPVEPLKEEQSMLPEKTLNLAKELPEFEPPKPVEKSKEGKPKIAIVIDDVGMNLKQSMAAIALDPAVTLAFLPYAESVKELAAKAKANGNEIIIHTPMEAMSSTVPLGSMALRSDMESKAFAAEFNKISNSFEGYVGINNHMGSKLTQDKVAMAQLMGELKNRNLFFLDSKTIATSVAAESASKAGVPFAVRDVFLDHEETPEFTANALAKLERIARESGQAIAIGHPKEITMAALQAWIPTLEAKGFELVPVSALLDKPNLPEVRQAGINEIKTEPPAERKMVKQENIVTKTPVMDVPKSIVTNLEPQHIEPAAGFSSYDEQLLQQNLLLLE